MEHPESLHVLNLTTRAPTKHTGFLACAPDDPSVESINNPNRHRNKSQHVHKLNKKAVARNKTPKL
eukprot:3719545-Amphidinium_carterae.1